MDTTSKQEQSAQLRERIEDVTTLVLVQFDGLTVAAVNVGDLNTGAANDDIWRVCQAIGRVSHGQLMTSH